MSRVALVLADRPTGRPALVALAAAVEASALAPEVELVLARGAEEMARAIRSGLERGQRVAVAWSFFSSEAEAIEGDLAAVRAAAPGALHLAGGPHASALPEATLALGFDLVARGEGEATIAGVLGALLDGGDPRRVPGLTWREGGTLAGSGRAAPVDLDAVPAFSRRLGKALALEVTRGCVWACRFCQTPFLHRARFRHRSIESVRAFARFAVELGHRDLRFLTPSALSYGASPRSAPSGRRSAPGGASSSGRFRRSSGPSTCPPRRWRCCAATRTTATCSSAPSRARSGSWPRWGEGTGSTT